VSAVWGIGTALLIIVGIFAFLIILDKLMMIKARQCEGVVVERGKKKGMTAPPAWPVTTEQYVIARYRDHRGRERTFSNPASGYEVGDIVEVLHRRHWPTSARIVGRKTVRQIQPQAAADVPGEPPDAADPTHPPTAA